MGNSKKAEMLNGMFSGATFNDSVVVGVAEAGSTVCYQTLKGKDEEEKAQEASSAKKIIIDYVNRLLPLVKEEYQKSYDDLWNGILEIKEVKLLVYKKGRQQETTFNRNLVAQIVHQISDLIYLPTANATQMAECLEPGKGVDHSVRQKLGETPDKVIKKSIEKYIEEFK